MTQAPPRHTHLQAVAEGPLIPISPGDLFLELFHGRPTPDETMEDWGEEGPVFGPFQYVHITYGEHIKMGLMPNDLNEVADLYCNQGLIYYNGLYYGDCSVFSGQFLLSEPQIQGRHQPFQASLALLPDTQPAKAVPEAAPS